jgi:peptidoglycan DL-endopeptidase CwlO
VTSIDLSAIIGRLQAVDGTMSSLGTSLSQAAQTGSFEDVMAQANAALSELDSVLAPTDTTGATATTGAGSGSSGVTGSDVVADARQYLGVPYQWGGTSPTTGFDCSGFVQHVYGDLGISLPRTSQEQATVGTAVPNLASAQPGDLLFFEPGPSGPGHVGIYVGGGMMIDAPHTGTSVQVQQVWTTPVAIRRIVSSGLGSGVSGIGSSGIPASLGVPGSLLGTFESAAQQYGVPPSLLAAVAKQESGFDPNAVSSAGAQGLMQLMPGTAAGLGVDPLDPSQAVDGAARLLSGYLSQYGGSVPLALAAYNAGPGAVAEYGGIPPYAETQAYVTDIMTSLGSAS